MFKRVLIANRGEIAVRIIRSLRDLGIESVAVYSEADTTSLHRLQADWAFPLQGHTAAASYLDIPQLQAAILASKADAVHPGYGFLSENPSFQKAVTACGATFIGPTAEAMQMMGDKVTARSLMAAHGIPIVPGSQAPLASLAELTSLAHQIGYPLILKAAAGGGGRGMRIVSQDSELADAFASCKREAQAYFGNPAVFCERYIANPRHIEIQVLFDHHGHGVHLFERDCSIQRRHQKLFEEAPSCYLNPVQRRRLGEMAVKAAAAADYHGAGTIEFICESPEQVYFMEMNTRIQVEHPVTELITGIDLIAEQIKVASGAPLGFTQDEVQLNGWAMEARINAEDPAAGFLPRPGLVRELRFPAGPFVRVDSHLYGGYEIPAHYDSMVAKIIVWGQDREQARRRMLRSLSDFVLTGVPTTAPFHEALLRHPAFAAGTFATSFLAQEEAYFKEDLTSEALPRDELALLAAVTSQYERQQAYLPTLEGLGRPAPATPRGPTPSPPSMERG